MLVYYIQELYCCAYYSTCVIKFSLNLIIQNNTVIINISNNYEIRNMNNTALLLPLKHISISDR
jgi:hypothetical protein